MPNKRRVLSCSSCRRLKTRCEVLPGATQCARCKTLRLACSLPSGVPAARNLDGLLPTNAGSRSDDTSSINEGCHCAARLDAIEASLSEIKELLRSQITTAKTSRSDRPTVGEGVSEDDEGIPAESPDSENVSTLFSIDEPAERIAPIKVVRELNNLISGPMVAVSDNHILEQLSEIGIDSHELAAALYLGFEQVSSQSPFVGNIDFMTMQNRHPLLFAVCLLMGVRTIPELNGSELHNRLYMLSKNCLGMSMLNTPLEIHTIYALFAFSTWNLTPDLRGRYIDSWLLSGSTITQCMLSLDISGLARITDFHIKDARERTRTWNLAALVHLKFSIGTGQPSVVDPDNLHRWAEITAYPGFEPWDRQIGSEIKLYLLLYNAVSKSNSSVAGLWRDIERWRCKNLDEDKDELQFAYACVALIVTRWELTKLHSDRGTPPSARVQTLIGDAIHHAQFLLMKTLSLCAATAFVKTSYDFLLCAYAGLTLVEYSSSLPNLQATYRLMEDVQMQSRMSKMAEPVFDWATGMMRKRAGDECREAERMAVHCVIQEPEPSADWIPSLLVDSVDPSLLSSMN